MSFDSKQHTPGQLGYIVVRPPSLFPESSSTAGRSSASQRRGAGLDASRPGMLLAAADIHPTPDDATPTPGAQIYAGLADHACAAAQTDAFPLMVLRFRILHR